MKTKDKNYTERLIKLDSRWKKILSVQLPYRLHLQSLHCEFVLDVGCGIGRNLINLDGKGIGVDHNPHSIEIARSRGLIAYTSEDFFKLVETEKWQFDTILLSHVLEHMTKDQAVNLLKEYLPYLPSKNRVVMIAPQEKGFSSDETHIEFTDFEKLHEISALSGLKVEKTYSVPLPRWCGKFFKHNEFVVIARKP